MGMRAAHEIGVALGRQGHVVEIAAAARDQANILFAPDRLTDAEFHRLPVEE
jgi:hypothetical protein